MVTNLTLSGLNTLFILPNAMDTVNAYHTNILYSGTLTGGAANIQVLATRNFTYTLVDPTTTPGAIVVQVAAVPPVDVWSGGSPGSETLWDNVTTNWIQIVGINAFQTNFASGSEAQFNDSALTNTPTLVGAHKPLGLYFEHTTLIYTFQGSGKLTGNGGVVMNGSGGGLILANTASNDFAGDVLVNNGSRLQIGNGATSGNIGSGKINVTNSSCLAFNRSDNVNFQNIINGGPGFVTNVGPGTLTLSANNTFSGQWVAQAGALQLNNNNALGGTNNSTGLIVSNGATLDTGAPSFAANGLTVTNMITVSGKGVGNLGAIVNTSTNEQFNALRQMTLAGDTWFGGPGNWQTNGSPGRWDIRGSITNAILSTSFNPYNLTKIGSNQVSFVGVSIDATPFSSLANITVQQGRLQFESDTNVAGRSEQQPDSQCLQAPLSASGINPAAPITGPKTSFSRAMA